MSDDKSLVREFWNSASCGEELYLRGGDQEAFQEQLRERYRLEPEILTFARFPEFQGADVLEIGVGLGADHQMWAQAGARLSGCDLTPRAIDFARQRFQQLGLESDLRVADAEQLPYEDEAFDLVYSWGVLHHSPDTPAAIAETLRVLRPGGDALIMIYHRRSIVAYMLWLRRAIKTGKVFTSMAAVLAGDLESPGTKGYSKAEARSLFRDYIIMSMDSPLTHGDLLTSSAGQRHRGRLLTLARAVHPRWLLRRICKQSGLFLMIQAKKPIE
jgi:ubiquinone/menaquinone biosynthesis C-methylase UbiE